MRIRHSFSSDWDGDPAIYFRIVFTDDSVKRYPLSELTHRIEDALIEDLALFTSEYSVYKRPSMGIAADFLELRRALGPDPAPGELEQASFRRSISTAYYGLFHLLVQDAVQSWNAGTKVRSQDDEGSVQCGVAEFLAWVER